MKLKNDQEPAFLGRSDYGMIAILDRDLLNNNIMVEARLDSLVFFTEEFNGSKSLDEHFFISSVAA